MLEEVRADLAARGTAFGLAEVHAEVRGLLDRAGLLAAIGPEMIFDDLDDALRAFEATQPEGRNPMTKKDKKAKEAEAPAASAPADAKKARNKAYEKELARLQVEIAHLQAWVKATGARIVIIFEGRDAAGKGGMIKRLTERVSPRVFRVVALPAPSDRQKTQIYMQRYIEQLPAAGEVLIFDRSWYNRPGVERVMGYCSEEAATRFLQEIPHLEALITEFGHHAAQVLPDRRRGGAGAPLPPAHRRSGAPVEAVADGPRILPPLVGLFPRLRRDDPPHRHAARPLVDRRLRTTRRRRGSTASATSSPRSPTRRSSTTSRSSASARSAPTTTSRTEPPATWCRCLLSLALSGEALPRRVHRTSRNGAVLSDSASRLAAVSRASPRAAHTAGGAQFRKKPMSPGTPPGKLMTIAFSR